jgi:membrane protein DedA with SNARE-associated domain
MVYELFLEVVHFVETLGYVGIFIMTFIESTFVPIPAEITLIPAGYLVQKGEMNFWIVLLVSVLGTIGGSLFNYYIAYFFGRRLFVSYGKYFFLKKNQLAKIEKFFENHGAISTFTGRLLPGIKHFISFPAGLAKMNIKLFVIYTAAGGFLWCLILILLGYGIGENEHLITKYLKQINLAVIILISGLIAYYIWRKNSAHLDDNKTQKD